MKKYILLFFTCFSFQATAQYKVYDSIPGITVVWDVYKDQNIFVQNSFINTLKRYCVDSIRIYRERYDIDLNVSAFEIRLDSIMRKLNSVFQVVIYHSEYCKLKIVFDNFDSQQPGKEPEYIREHMYDSKHK